MFAQERRASDYCRRIRQLDRITYRQILSTFGMVDLDHGAGVAEGLLLGQFLHRKDRAVGHIEGIERGHHIHLVHGHGPLLDFRKDLIQFVEARLGGVVFRIIEPILMPDDPGQCRKGS